MSDAKRCIPEVGEDGEGALLQAVPCRCLGGLGWSFCWSFLVVGWVGLAASAAAARQGSVLRAPCKDVCLSCACRGRPLQLGGRGFLLEPVPDVENRKCRKAEAGTPELPAPGLCAAPGTLWSPRAQRHLLGPASGPPGA